MEKLQSSYIAGGDVKWCSHCGRKFGSYQLKLEFSYDTEIKHVHVKFIHECSYRKSLIAAKYKQPKNSSTDKWLNKMWYIYTMEYYSAIKRNEVQMDITYR